VAFSQRTGAPSAARRKGSSSLSQAADNSNADRALDALDVVNLRVGGPHGPTETSIAEPLIGMAQAGSEGFFDDGGYPAGAGWEEVELPTTADANAYALSISGDSMEPVYRDGDAVIVSPASPVRVGDRVVARATDGAVMAKLLTRRTATRIELSSLNPAHALLRFAVEDIVWMHRIIWASQ